jgi:hypothetical protein
MAKELDGRYIIVTEWCDDRIKGEAVVACFEVLFEDSLNIHPYRVCLTTGS